ncbi:Ppx/GppA family phosphatase [Aquisediminimonas sediminicola]|uniref:Ppx/GppA phosphatase family protein n=1 Tax=Alteraquisediminimonas sediminicola TaxID=2676787 RepID=UPI001C8DEB50
MTKFDSSRRRTAIVDIGSNSVRLVIYDGPARAPNTLFNEKVLAGLGKNMGADGTLDPAAWARTIGALKRFVAILHDIAVDDVQTVATAAVRDALNGRELLDEIRALGLDPRILSGSEEARTAALGVIAGMPDADGIVGDLGGGSLELARVQNGEITDVVSFPLGVLRLSALREKDPKSVEHLIRQAITDAGWAGRGKDLPLYLVGGSWRSLAKAHMYFNQYPLPIVHAYSFSAESVPWLQVRLATMDRQVMRQVANVSSARLRMLGEASELLAQLVRALGTSQLIASAFGLREGLLYASLDPKIQAIDPLIALCREEAFRQGRYPEHGAVLDRWIAPALEYGQTPDPALARLRLAACTLADVSWRAHPDFRPERGVEIALHGNLVGIDGEGRAVLAAILYAGLGGHPKRLDPIITELASVTEIDVARRAGMAIRLAQRWSAGTAAPLARSRLMNNGRELILCFDPADQALYGETVIKLHEALAAELCLVAATAPMDAARA